jgi:hypothetical protein
LVLKVNPLARSLNSQVSNENLLKMKSLLMVMLGMIFFSQLSAQNNGDLSLGKGGKLYQGTTLLKPKDMLRIMEPNPQAYATFKKARANYNAAIVLGAAGGFLVGYPLGTALGGGDPQWGLAAGGVALILIALPLDAAFKKNARIAIDLYNTDKGKTAQQFRPQLHVGMQRTGVGMSLRF